MVSRLWNRLARPSAAFCLRRIVSVLLSLTGYTCADLFHQQTLQQGARAALLHLANASKSIFSGLAVVGLPLALNDQLFNCAAVLHRGRILGLVPKSYLPNYKEFYEERC